MARPIDSHVHLYPPEANRDPAGWAKVRREPHWAALCTRRRRDGRPVQSFPSLDDLLRDMDRAGVERAVLLGWYWETPASCAEQNRFYARCLQSYPDRLSGFAAVHPGGGAEALRAEMRRCRQEGLSGLGELSPHSQGFPVDHPAWEEALSLAGQWGFPVTLHVTDPDSPSFPGRVSTHPDDFLRLARQFPQTHFILAHWGGLLPLRLPGAAKMANLSYDTAASALLYPPEIWQQFLSVVGPDRVLFGSDYPLNLYPKLDAEPDMSRFVAEARESISDPAARAAVLRDNSLRVLSAVRPKKK